ncbi:Thioredoxin domain-containing protein [Yarrowia sp. B02]|nr:Thioredoxin domain-containing protein [Yarrowia sp. B02]
MSLLDKYNSQLVDEGDAEDQEFLDLLDDDEAFKGYREQRIAELSRQMKEAKDGAQSGHGTVQTLDSDKDVLEATTSADRCVIHFFHPDFARCKVMDAKLEQLAARHLGTRFVRVDASKAPFLATKLGLKALPVVVCYIKGQEATRIVGFERLGGTDNFQLSALENLLFTYGVIQRVGTSGMKRAEKKVEEEDSDWSD